MLQYYNPENDLCLASGLVNYTPPMAAQHLRSAGALLPLWYGEPGDQVLCFGVNERWYDQMIERFNIPVGLWNHEINDSLMPSPWGWSASVKKYFLDLGFPASNLPTDQQIETMRRLSHRSTAASVHRKLKECLPDIPLATPAKELFTISDDFAEMKKMVGADHVMIKFPWSSSGRGLANTRQMGWEKTLRMARESISKQGSVMIEPFYDIGFNFAIIYECRNGQCHDLGTSVFSTDNRGIYLGNFLGSESKRLGRVKAHYPLELLSVVRQTLRDCIATEIAPFYNGILGVDMLVTKDGILDPVVEINLRKTMGWVANRFADNYLHNASTGVLSVCPMQGKNAVNNLNADVVIIDHRLLSGSLCLTPSNNNFIFQVLANTIDAERTI